jgi:O-antigen ligase
MFLLLHLFGIDSFLGIPVSLHRGHTVLTFKNLSRASLYLATSAFILFFFFFSGKSILKKLFLILSSSISIFFLLNSQERASIAAFLLSIVLFFLFSKKWKYFFTFTAIAATVVFYFGNNYSRLHLDLEKLQKSSSYYERETVWYGGIKIFLDKPVLGCGFKNFKEESQKYISEFRKAHYPNKKKYASLGDAHNLPLNTLAEGGILGFLGINGIFFLTLFRCYKKSKSDPDIMCLGFCILLFYIHSQLNAHLYSDNVGEFVFLLLGAASGAYHLANEPQKSLATS